MKLFKILQVVFGKKQPAPESVKINVEAISPKREKTALNGNVVKTPRKTKYDLVKKHLQEKQSITSWEAIELYGATRLSAIIFTLRKRGYEVDTIMITAKDRYNNTSNYAQYWLLQNEQI